MQGGSNKPAGMEESSDGYFMSAIVEAWDQIWAHPPLTNEGWDREFFAMPHEQYC